MQPVQPPRKSSGCGLALGIGCGTIAILFIIGGVIIFFTWRKMVTGILRTGIDQMVKGAKLSPDEQKRVSAALDKVCTRFENNQLSQEQLKKLGQAFEKGVLLKAIQTHGLRFQVEASGLSPEEKQVGVRSLNRVLRGVHEKKISEEEWGNLTDKFPHRKRGEKEWDFDSKVDDAKLQEILGDAKALADSKTIPDEDYQFDFAGEVEKVVDEALGEEEKSK
ncbi:MAG: hypothetical protein HY717_09910 [Planctomycetes bacterium]|nr:hypothetical protein [Planctomycetota bacterium]